MRFHRFYLPGRGLEAGKEIKIQNSELINQLRNVLRLQTGSQIIFFDGSGADFMCRVESTLPYDFRIAVLTKKENKNMPKIKIALYQSLIKKDNFEWVLEKGTELGVSEFHPVLSERSEKKSLNIPRAEKILAEASEQSGRGVVPKIFPVESLEDILKQFQEKKLAPAERQKTVDFIVFHPNGEKFEPTKIFNSPDEVSAELKIFVGPEGGWSEREIKMFESAGAKIFSLGPQILRAETAAIAVSSLLLLETFLFFLRPHPSSLEEGNVEGGVQ